MTRTLPPDLPVPEDDGAADHLVGLELPDLTLASSQGDVNVRDFTVIYVYPRSGKPGVPLLAGLGRDARRARLHAAVVRVPRPVPASSACAVAGLSAQTLDDQVEFAERNRMPFPVIADPGARLGAALGCRRSRSRASPCTSGSRSSPRGARSSRSSIPCSRPTGTQATC